MSRVLALVAFCIAAAVVGCSSEKTKPVGEGTAAAKPDAAVFLYALKTRDGELRNGTPWIVRIESESGRRTDWTAPELGVGDGQDTLTASGGRLIV